MSSFSTLPTMANPNGNQARYQCPDCSTTVSRQSDIPRHLIERHGPPNFCPVLNCNYHSRRRGRVERHMNTAHPGRFQVQLEIPEDFLLGRSAMPALSGNMTQDGRYQELNGGQQLAANSITYSTAPSSAPLVPAPVLHPRVPNFNNHNDVHAAPQQGASSTDGYYPGPPSMYIPSPTLPSGANSRPQGQFNTYDVWSSHDDQQPNGDGAGAEGENYTFSTAYNP